MLKRDKLMMLVGGILGAIIFILLYGVWVLNVNYDGWLLSFGGDLTQHYVGWLFFRQSPWTIPIGQVTGLLYPFNSPIILSDSIPLFALIFKIFAEILPNKFQYFGIFEFFCFILQGVLSTVIIYKITNNRIIACIGSMFFCVAPIMLFRMFGHASLSAHFILLISFILWMYKDKLDLKKRVLICGLQALLCATVTLYFFPMIFSMLFFLLFDSIFLTLMSVISIIQHRLYVNFVI